MYLTCWPFCAHIVFSREFLSWTDTRPVDDKYNVEKLRCALLKNKRPQMLQEWTSEVLASELGMGEAALEASRWSFEASNFFKETSWEGNPTRPGERGQGKAIQESWLSEATTSYRMQERMQRLLLTLSRSTESEESKVQAASLHSQRLSSVHLLPPTTRQSLSQELSKYFRSHPWHLAAQELACNVSP